MRRLQLDLLRCLLPVAFGLVFPLALQPVWLADVRLPGDSLSEELMRAQQEAEFEPWLAQSHERLGLAWLESGEYSNALETLSAAEALGGLSGDGKIALAVSLTNVFDHRAGAAWLQALSQPDLKEFLFLQADRSLRQMGLLSERTEAAEMWVAAYPASALAHLALGACLSVQQPDRAIASLYVNGQVVAGGQILWAALDNFSRSDDLGRGWMEVGQALGQLGEWRLAAAAFEYSVDAEPRLAETWALLGEARDQAGLDGGQALQTAYSLNNQSAVTLGLLGLHERRARNYGGAMMYFERAARLEPAKAIWQLELAATYEALGDLPRTQSFLVEAARLEPRNPQVWRTIAAFTLAHAVEISETGLPAARQAAALAPEDPLSLDMMGQVLLALGDAPTARRYFSQAVDIAPTNAALWYHLGQAAAATNDNTTAYNAFMNVVQMAGSGDLVDLANQYLQKMEGE